MSEMVERVAEAIYQAGHRQDAESALVQARAAIKAMMEPTEVMLARANHLNHPRDIEVWQTMLIAALEESKE